MRLHACCPAPSPHSSTGRDNLRHTAPTATAESSPQPPCTKPAQQHRKRQPTAHHSHSGCRSTRKGTMRRICRGSLPLKTEIQAILCNPSRPGSQPRAQQTRKRIGVQGESLFDSTPAAFRRFRRAKAASQAADGTSRKRKRTPERLPPFACGSPSLRAGSIGTTHSSSTNRSFSVRAARFTSRQVTSREECATI